MNVTGESVDAIRELINIGVDHQFALGVLIGGFISIVNFFLDGEKFIRYFRKKNW